MANDDKTTEVQGRRVGFARGGANMFWVELDMMVDMGRGLRGGAVPPPFGKFVLI